MQRLGGRAGPALNRCLERRVMGNHLRPAPKKLLISNQKTLKLRKPRHGRWCRSPSGSRRAGGHAGQSGRLARLPYASEHRRMLLPPFGYAEHRSVHLKEVAQRLDVLAPRCPH